MEWARPHQTVAFFGLTFVFTWAFWIPSAVMFTGAVDPDALIASPLFVALQTLGAAGPSIVAVALTRTLHGKEALRALLKRFRPARQLAGWYCVAAVLAPALTLVAMAIDTLAFGKPFVSPESGLAEMVAEMGWLGAVAVLPVVLATQLFSSPLLEEAGWRGFALPRMQVRASALTASLALGVTWGFWHLPLVVAYGDPFAPYLAGIVAYTVLMTWIFNSGSGNLFLMLLFHASLNLSLNILLPLQAGWTPALVAWSAVLVVVFLFGRKNLSRRERYVEQSDGIGVSP
ncbi:MAG: CPBP family glutamic-type intramembrane protease [Coriobacteriia bacterium]|nr:CPBP family glutamic-type intramembrane protease [Coriobacteriia bacterium]